jgi:1-deoxy-D-xylulose-5-phosphate reductoisomerase
LFDIPASKIEVIIHPQSIIHSMVEYNDGSIIAQMGIPDMKIPIAYALSYPEHIPLDLPRCDLLKEGPLSFEAPDTERFPCLALAYQALQVGGTMPAVLNAANEVAVQGFLDDKIAFLDIEGVIEGTMAAHSRVTLDTLEDALSADRWAREHAGMMLNDCAADGVMMMRRAGHA